jgi:transposase-like protein
MCQENSVISERHQGLLEALAHTFPRNHCTQCIIHIHCNVLSKFKSQAAFAEVGKIAKTFSYYQEHEMLEIIKKSSPDSYDYVLSIDAAK